MKVETEALIGQSILSILIRQPTRRMCGEMGESVGHIVYEFKNFTYKEYQRGMTMLGCTSEAL